MHTCGMCPWVLCALCSLPCNACCVRGAVLFILECIRFVRLCAVCAVFSTSCACMMTLCALFVYCCVHWRSCCTCSMSALFVVCAHMRCVQGVHVCGPCGACAACICAMRAMCIIPDALVQVCCVVRANVRCYAVYFACIDPMCALCVLVCALYELRALV